MNVRPQGEPRLRQVTLTARFAGLLSVFELARIELVLSAVSAVWLMIFLALSLEPATRRNPALEELGLIPSLMLAVVLAAGLSASGMALNDVLDARHDRAFAPTRPIPAGRVPSALAVAVSMLSLVAALAAAVFFGTASMFIALLTAAGVIFYNLTGRFVPAIGVINLGLLHSLLLVMPNPRLSFAWPILLSLLHVMTCAALRHWLVGKRPRLSVRGGWVICLGWVFLSLMVIALMRVRHPPGGYEGEGFRLVWVGPAIVSALFLLTAGWVLQGTNRSIRPQRRAGARFARLSVLWLIVYDAAWLLSAGLMWQGLVVVGLLGAAIGLGWLQQRLGGPSDVAVHHRMASGAPLARPG